MTPNEYEELRQDMMEELRLDSLRDSIHEERMYNDFDYAIEKYADEMQDAYDKLKSICDKLHDYGWEETPESLMRMI